MVDFRVLLCLFVATSALQAGAQESGLDAPPYNATAVCSGGDRAVGFISGVASGDATQDAVIIWTRFQPADENGTYQIGYVVSTDPSLSPVVANGTLTARPDSDFTVKQDITGLQPNTTYYYAFRQGDYSSHLGRTRTLPALDQDVSRLRYVILSCANWGYGFFNVRETLIPPREIYTLTDYQQRMRLYKTDPSLQELHRRVPMYAIWDDHDQADNSWKNGSYNTFDAQAWQRRKTNSDLAYKQYMPVRETQGADMFALYRSFTYGNMATMVLPETRMEYRTEQVDPMKHPYIQTLEQNDPDKWDSLPQLPDLRKSYIDYLHSPNFTQLGPQLNTVEQDFSASKAAGVPWQIFCTPTIFSPRRTPDIETAIDERYGRLVNYVLDGFLNFATGNLATEQLKFGGSARALIGTGKYHDTMFTDSWDGYEYEREELLKIFANSTNHAVVVTGDSHNAWASNLYSDMIRYTPNATVSDQGPILGVEFATASVTAPGTESYVEVIKVGDVLGLMSRGLFLSNPELVYANLKDRGAIILTTTKDEMKGDYYFVTTIEESSYKPDCQKSLTVVAGQMDKGLQNSTCTPADDILFTFYSSQDRLPQGATLTTPAFQGTSVSNCGASDSTPPFIAVTFSNPQGDSGQEDCSGVFDCARSTVSGWFG
ncbi:hypothetical protein N2152v2_001854 [Parachlorella kessleri]